MANRIKMRKTIAGINGPSTEPELFDVSDIEEVGTLMKAAYEGTPDYEGETEEEATAELRNLMKGYYGTFLQDHSYVVRNEDDCIVSAVFLTMYKDEPTITYLFTSPEHKNRGYARELLNAVSDSLFTEGIREVYLFVNELNEAAINLYRSEGFQEIPISPRKKEKYLEETLERELP